MRRAMDTLRSLSGRPMLYTSPGYIGWAGATDWRWMAEYPLWLARYNPAPMVPAPQPWDRWEVWQYTSQGDAAKHGASSTFIDLNRSYRTLMQLRALRLS